VVAALVTTGLLLPVAAGTATAAPAVPAPSETPAPSPSPSPSTPPADVLAPTFTVTPTDPIEVDGTLQVEVAETLQVTFSEPVTGVDSGTLRLRSTPSTVKSLGDGKSFLLRSVRPLYAGARYVIEASPRIVDTAGNAHVPVPAYVMAYRGVDDRSAGMRLLGSWTRLAASGAFNGSYVRSVPTPTRWSATHTDVHGSGAEIWGCVGPGNGIFEVWVDGRRLRSVDSYARATSCDVELAEFEFPTGSGLHMVEVRGMGQKRAASRGAAIAIDAVIVLL
jgi:hypothetical protein